MVFSSVSSGNWRGFTTSHADSFTSQTISFFNRLNQLQSLVLGAAKFGFEFVAEFHRVIDIGDHAHVKNRSRVFPSGCDLLAATPSGYPYPWPFWLALALPAKPDPSPSAGSRRDDVNI
jgi:hypothetical protein